MAKRKIRDNSKTNCPACGKKKPFLYVGECSDCTYGTSEIGNGDEDDE